MSEGPKAVDGPADEPSLSPMQQRALSRIQLVGVLIILGSMLIAGWSRDALVVTTCLALVVIALLGLGHLAARVRREPFRAAVAEANREVIHDFAAKRKDWSERFGHRS